MSFHNRQSNFPIKPQVSFNKLNLEYTAETKCLCIHITERVKWNSHVQLLANKLSKVLFIVKSSKGILSPGMIRNVYYYSILGTPTTWDTIFFGG
jgi:hypothetical protein